MSYNDHRPPQGPPSKPPFGSTFFDSLRRSTLRRPLDRWVGGVASALAYRMGWDPILVRGLVLILALFTFGGVIVLYALGWALLPDAVTGRIHLEDLFHGNFDIAHVGIILLFIWGLTSNDFSFGVRDSGWISITGLVVTALIIAAAMFVAIRGGNQSPPPRRRPPHPSWQAPDAGSPSYHESTPETAKEESLDANRSPADHEGGSTQESSTPLNDAPHAASTSGAAYETPRAQWEDAEESAVNDQRPSRTFDAINDNPRPHDTGYAGNYAPEYLQRNSYDADFAQRGNYGAEYAQRGGYGPQGPASPEYPQRNSYGAAQRQAFTEPARGEVEPGPGLSTFLGITGLLFVTFAVLWGSWMTGMFMEPTIIFTVTVGIAYVVTGLVLGVRALQGKRGTWLTGLSAAVTVLLPAFIGLTAQFVTH
ncbi:MAG: PspC domain-containing protein [Actinomycetaceae bacterium]|nr:PspC domain-containing protein [Actinomycetaceae bacterium]